MAIYELLQRLEMEDLFLGLATFLWLVIWMIYASDTPATHRLISPEEKQYIVESLSHMVEEETGKTVV